MEKWEREHLTRWYNKKKNRDNYPFSSTKSHLCWVPPSEISMESSQQKVATSNNKATANSVTQHTASEPTRIICRVRELLQRKYWSGAQNKKKKAARKPPPSHQSKAKIPLITGIQTSKVTAPNQKEYTKAKTPLCTSIQNVYTWQGSSTS